MDMLEIIEDLRKSFESNAPYAIDTDKTFILVSKQIGEMLVEHGYCDQEHLKTDECTGAHKVYYKDLKGV